MCDIKKYQDIYQEIKDLDPDDTLQLIAEAQSRRIDSSVYRRCTFMVEEFVYIFEYEISPSVQKA